MGLQGFLVSDENPVFISRNLYDNVYYRSGCEWVCIVSKMHWFIVIFSEILEFDRQIEIVISKLE